MYGHGTNRVNAVTVLSLPADAVGVHHGRCRYTEDLHVLHLHAASPHGLTPKPVAGFLPQQAWNLILVSLPDQCYAAFLRRGIYNGFRIGWDPHSKLRPASSKGGKWQQVGWPQPL